MLANITQRNPDIKEAPLNGENKSPLIFILLLTKLFFYTVINILLSQIRRNPAKSRIWELFKIKIATIAGQGQKRT